MFEQYALLVTVLVTGIGFINMLQHEAFEERISPGKRSLSLVSRAESLLIWSLFAAFVCTEYFYPHANVFDGTTMI